MGPEDLDENKARVLVEKKTAINLLEAFSVAIKHYLRFENGIRYEDLYHLVKFLPAYSLPPTIPSAMDISDPMSTPFDPDHEDHTHGETAPDLPLPITSPSKKALFFQPLPTVRSQKHPITSEKPRPAVGLGDEELRPAHIPPKYTYFNLFPRKAVGQKAIKQATESQNLPLEISLYLVCSDLAIML